MSRRHFLNADWKDEDEVVLVVKPPLIFTELGALERDTFYRTEEGGLWFQEEPEIVGRLQGLGHGGDEGGA